MAGLEVQPLARQNNPFAGFVSGASDIGGCGVEAPVETSDADAVVDAGGDNQDSAFPFDLPFDIEVRPEITEVAAEELSPETFEIEITEEAEVADASDVAPDTDIYAPVDYDQDGYYSCETTTEELCDCDDENPYVHPETLELCNDGIDNDCDNVIDEGCEPSCIDNDKDGYGQNCALGTDCNDNNNKINPSSQEACNNIDDNCNNQTDENNICYAIYYCDIDNDSHYDQNPSGNCNSFGCLPPNCQEAAGNDCNDNESAIYTGAPELCDEIDNNCNNIIDEGCEPDCIDNDSDGFGQNCILGTDCNDANSNINPLAEEICDGEDNNCNQQIDENQPDLKTYTGPWWTENNDPCQPQIEECIGGVYIITQPEIVPQEEIACDGIDQDCSGADLTGTDWDNDGFSPQGGNCGPEDCDDSNKFVNPGLIEICDSIDNNCDDEVDEGCSAPFSPPPAPFNPESGMFRGVFDGGLPGDSGRTKLGNFDDQTGLFHYFAKFYWDLDSGEKVNNGQPVSIAEFANEVWQSGRMPFLVIKVDNFSTGPFGLTNQAKDALREFAYWLHDEYQGQIAVSLLQEMNLAPQSEYCDNFSSDACLLTFLNAFEYASKMLQQAAPGIVHVGLNYNMRWAGEADGLGAFYSDWLPDNDSYSWIGYNIFVHTCATGEPETQDPWFLKAALAEPGNNFLELLCDGGKPCIIAETGASNQCSPGFQNFWLDHFETGDYSGSPYINIHMPQIKGCVWFNHNNESLGGWEENWMIEDFAHYQTIFGDAYYKDAP